MMKIKHMILAGGLLAMGLASCEMKNEIFGNKNQSSEVGLLNLSVEVDAKSNDVVTKADGTQDGGINQGTPVDPINYTVEISNSKEVYKTLAYDPENNTIELPVDKYTIYAHTPGEPTETEAYYGGRNTLEIKKDIPSNVGVTCKMMNTKIQLAFDASMNTHLKTGELIVTAGSTNSKTFNYENSVFDNPAAFFWMMEEGTKEIRVSFVGTNKEDKKVRQSYAITKPVEAVDKNWIGGDVLIVTLKAIPSDPENPNGVLGIEINAEVKWNGIENNVDAPVENEEKPTEPEQPETLAPTITGDCIGKEISYKTGDPAPAIEVLMEVLEKIEDVRVRITTDNAQFEKALTALELAKDGGATLIDNDDLKGLFDLPKKGATSFSFSLSQELLNMLSLFPGTHAFQLMVEDQAGKSATAGFKIIIEESQAQ